MTTDDFHTHWYSDINILTYGEITDKEVCDNFQTILQWKNDGIYISESKDMPEFLFTTQEYWLYLSIMYQLGYIEYGTSPRTAWLTDLGKEVLAVLPLIKFTEDGEFDVS